MAGTYAQMKFAQEFPVADLDNSFIEISQNLTAMGINDPRPLRALEDTVVKNKRVHYYSVGTIYESGPFRSQLMLSRTVHESGRLKM